MDNKEELGTEEQALLEKVKDFVEGAVARAYEKGFMDGLKQATGVDEGGVLVKRFIFTPLTLIAILIIMLGGCFSLGMYIGGSL
jgi:hypothetical protein